MNDTLYRLLVGVIDAFIWGGELIGEENLPEKGPAVFIVNHLGPTGPIGAVCSIPLRLYPWIIADMVDEEKAAAYLNWDFVERTLKLKPPLSLVVAKALSRITVPMLTSFGCIPAFQGYEDVQGALKTSVDLLREGKYIFICPEDNRLEMDQASKMQPFKKGFTRLGKLYFEETGKRLDFYPVAVHESSKVKVGNPIAYNPLNPPARERLRLRNLLEEMVRRMYLEMAGVEVVGVPVASECNTVGRRQEAVGRRQ